MLLLLCFFVFGACSTARSEGNPADFAGRSGQWLEAMRGALGLGEQAWSELDRARRRSGCEPQGTAIGLSVEESEDGFVTGDWELSLLDEMDRELLFVAGEHQYHESLADPVLLGGGIARGQAARFSFHAPSSGEGLLAFAGQWDAAVFPGPASGGELFGVRLPSGRLAGLWTSCGW